MSKRILTVLAAIVALAAPLAGQTSGTIRGSVSDASGAPAAGAEVKLVGPQGVERVVTTGESGSYLISSVPPGVYSVSVSHNGVEGPSVQEVRVSIGGSATVNLTLAPNFTEEMMVSAAPILDLSTAQVSASYDAEFLDEMPTRRNFWDMVSLSPGVTQSTEWTAGQSAFGSGITSNSWNVDGLNVTAPETGGSWWYLNPETVQEIQVLGIGASAEYGNATGASINVVTKSGTNEFKGSVNAFLQFDALTDTNVELEDAEFPSYHRDSYHNITGTLGGPIVRDRAWFFAAAENNRDRESEPGVDPNFPARYDWDRYDVKFDWAFNERARLDAKGHAEDWSATDSGDAYTANSARGIAEDENPAWGLGFNYVLSNRSLLEVNYAGWWGTEDYHSLTGSQEPAFADYSPPDGGPTRYYGGLLYPFTYETGTDQADVKVSHFADDFLGGDHDFRFGVGYNYGTADTITKAAETGGFYYHYTYDYYGTPYEYYYLYTFTPFHYGGKQEALSAFVDDSWKVTDRLTLNLGVRWDRHQGRIPSYERLDGNGNGTGVTLPGIDDVIDWNLISPRLGFAWVATADQKTVLRGSYGVYHDGNVSGNWNYPPPAIPPIQTFLCDGLAEGCDDLYSEDVFTPFGLNVDPNLSPPRSEQYALGVERQIGDKIGIGITGVYKTTEDLVGWEILGDGIYEEISYTDPFGDVHSLLNICEDGCRAPTVRKGNRPGVGSLAPDEKYHQEYSALMLTFDRRYADGWSLKGSYTWSKSEGLLPRPQIQSQGSTLYGSLDGTDPNEWLNAEQYLQNDRTHVFRLQGYVDLPWKTQASMSTNWQTGRPYARLDRVSGRILDQGNTFIIIDPASNDHRLPTSLLIDLGLRKDFALGNDMSLEVGLDVFNILNEDANTSWDSQWVGPDEQYTASNYVWPRRAMVRLGLKF